MIHEFTLVLDREPPRRNWAPWPRPGWTRSAPRAHTQSWHTLSAAAALPAAIITTVRAIDHLGIAAIKIRSAQFTSTEVVYGVADPGVTGLP